MPQAAIHDFFKQIRVQDNNQGGAVDQTLVADSTTDTLLITSHGGLVFESPNAATDTFGLNVDYSVNVPLGTTALTLTDIISNSTNVNFTGGPGVTVVRNSANELEIGLEEGYTAIKKFAIGADDSTLRFLDDGESALFLGTGGIATSSDAEGNITIDGSAISSGALGSLSVTTNAPGTAALSYNSGTGVFTYTPPDLSSYLTSETSHADVLVDGDFATAGFMKTDGAGNYSIDANTYLTAETSHADVLVDGDFASAGFMKTDGAGNYSIDASTYLTSYTETDPIFSAHTTSNIVDGTGFLKNTAGTWSYDNNTYLTSETSHADVLVDGDFATAGFMKTDGAGNYTVDNSTYLTSFTETNDLTAAVTWANVPDANITQSSVTQHQAALSITESQISDLGSYLTDLTGSSVGTLSDVNFNSVTLDASNGQDKVLAWDQTAQAFVPVDQSSGGTTTFGIAGNTGTHTFDMTSETLTFLGTTGQLTFEVATNFISVSLDPVLSVDLKGSVFADDSTPMVDAIENTMFSSMMTLSPLSAAPTTPAIGMIVVADYNNWDPLGSAIARPYVVFYDGAVWQPVTPIA